MSTPTTTQSDIFSAIRPEYSDHSIAAGIAAGRIYAGRFRIVAFIPCGKTCYCRYLNKRANKLSFTLVGWRRFIGPFRELTITDVYTGIEALKSGRSRTGRPFKQNTLADHVVILKRFLLWAIENGYSTIPEKKVRALKTSGKEHR